MLCLLVLRSRSEPEHFSPSRSQRKKNSDIFLFKNYLASVKERKFSTISIPSFLEFVYVLDSNFQRYGNRLFYIAPWEPAEFGNEISKTRSRCRPKYNWIGSAILLGIVIVVSVIQIGIQVAWILNTVFFIFIIQKKTVPVLIKTAFIVGAQPTLIRVWLSPTSSFL